MLFNSLLVFLFLRYGVVPTPLENVRRLTLHTQNAGVHLTHIEEQPHTHPPARPGEDRGEWDWGGMGMGMRWNKMMRVYVTNALHVIPPHPPPRAARPFGVGAGAGAGGGERRNEGVDWRCMFPEQAHAPYPYRTIFEVE